VQGAENITSAYARYGGFSLRFVPFNLYVSLLRPPDIFPQFPFLRPSPWGMSILLVTPAFWYLFRAFRREPLVIASWAGLLGVMIRCGCITILARSSSAIAIAWTLPPFLMLLTASGMRGQISPLSAGW
jgi:hypothetical protein